MHDMAVLKSALELIYKSTRRNATTNQGIACSTNVKWKLKW